MKKRRAVCPDTIIRLSTEDMIQFNLRVYVTVRVHLRRRMDSSEVNFSSKQWAVRSNNSFTPLICVWLVVLNARDHTRNKRQHHHQYIAR